MNWFRIIGVALGAAEAIKGAKGEEKKEHAITQFAKMIPSLDKATLEDPEVQAALRAHIDAGVTLRNIVLVKTGRDIFLNW